MTVCPLPGARSQSGYGDFPEAAFDIADGDGGVAILGGGCFWCTEAVYRQLKGVRNVEAGYAGGSKEQADYQTVCSGNTGHAEVIRVDYDPEQIRFGQLLKVFFSVAHDPTQLNRQGNDTGTQYRSVVFPQSEDQAEVTRRYIEQLTQAQVFTAPIVTTIESGDYYKAEDYHQDYAALNPRQPYINAVAQPKVAKLRKSLADMCNESQSTPKDKL